MPAWWIAVSLCGAATTACTFPDKAARTAAFAESSAARPCAGLISPMRSSPGASWLRSMTSTPSSDRPQACACAVSTPRSPTSNGRHIARATGSSAALREISGPMPEGSPVAMATVGSMAAILAAAREQAVLGDMHGGVGEGLERAEQEEGRRARRRQLRSDEHEVHRQDAQVGQPHEQRNVRAVRHVAAEIAQERIAVARGKGEAAQDAVLR